MLNNIYNIVCIHLPHVRPMVRGKAKIKVVFGTKIDVSNVSGYSFINHHSWNAYNGSSDISEHLDFFENRYEANPKQFFGDKIYITHDKRKKLQENYIEIRGALLVSPTKNPTPEQLEQVDIWTSLRNVAETQFGIEKRVFRAPNIRVKFPKLLTLDCEMLLRQEYDKIMGGVCRIRSEICHLLRHLYSDSKIFTFGNNLRDYFLLPPIRVHRCIV